MDMALTQAWIKEVFSMRHAPRCRNGLCGAERSTGGYGGRADES